MQIVLIVGLAGAAWFFGTLAIESEPRTTAHHLNRAAVTAITVSAAVLAFSELLNLCR